MAAYSILIVDDDVRFGRCAKRAMSCMGHIVEQFSRSCEILDRHDIFAPDFIFLDIFMPDFDGIEVSNWLSEKRFSGTLVFMSGFDPAYLTAARTFAQRRSKAKVATLEKPARVEEFLELLRG